VCAALTEDGFSTNVRAAENGGRRLDHDGVVRAFITVPFGPLNKTTLKLTPLLRYDRHIAWAHFSIVP
jgi:hypothetical protein